MATGEPPVDFPAIEEIMRIRFGKAVRCPECEKRLPDTDWEGAVNHMLGEHGRWRLLHVGTESAYDAYNTLAHYPVAVLGRIRA